MRKHLILRRTLNETTRDRREERQVWHRTYREAVAELSPGLPRLAATPGKGHNESNPNGVASASLEQMASGSGKVRLDIELRGRCNPVGVAFLSTFRSQGCRAARQPWALLHNRFAVNQNCSEPLHRVTTGPMRTTSKLKPLIFLSMPRSSLLQRGSGAPLKNQPGPLSATNIPYFFRARRITWFPAE